MQAIAHRAKDIGIIDEHEYILFRTTNLKGSTQDVQKQNRPLPEIAHILIENRRRPIRSDNPSS
jgi:hypothetical protein